ncbi:hypothetical protein AURDEDRAFT_172052 [Auricularia subglabra TFB-10046 SS5]|nr:hypothetical protein AURDEDRAFT_172052 [Auricularia subglabra TFB-10046 SS5]
MFARALVLLTSIAFAAAVCETSNNSPWTSNCYEAADYLMGQGGNPCCQTSGSGCTAMVTRGTCRVAICGPQICRPCDEAGRYTRDLINACKNDAIGKVGGKSNDFFGLHLELWYA